MQAALYARRVVQACSFVKGHNKFRRWCSPAVGTLQPCLRRTPPAAHSSSPAVSSPEYRTGLVLSSQANYYRVRVECQDSVPGAANSKQMELLCKKRSLLRKKGGYVLVGDQVEVVSIDWLDGRGLVSSVLPRRTETSNPRVANVDHVALVFSVREPWFEPFQADVQRVVDQVEGWGYRAVPMSVRDGQGMHAVCEAMVGHTSVLAGPSGVGKSSIINALRAEAFDEQQLARLADFERKMDEEESLWRQYHEGSDEANESEDEAENSSSAALAAGSKQEPQQSADGSLQGDGNPTGPSRYSGTEYQQGNQAMWRQRNKNIYGAQAVGNVGHRSKRGRHTTRSAVLLDLPAGGLLVDTPGFNYPAMERVTPDNVQRYFPEIQHIMATSDCKFANCSHVHEPQCAVRDAHWERYPFYVRILEEALERDEVENTKLQMNRRRQQGTTKTWKGKGGVDMEVAKLEAKVHRRTSRTSKKLQVKKLLGQELDD